jgi:signal transduction histidine kinase
LFKDITEYKKSLQTIKNNQNMLIERERLASLGQLVGGIAHNLKTPIMTISGGLEALKDLIKEYDASIENSSVTKEDHHEIAQEMTSWIEKIKPHCSYMSDIISAVKGQAVQLIDSSSSSFTIGELVNRVHVLMKHEVKQSHCRLNTELGVDKTIVVQGEVNNLVQIIDNIIINAIYAYEGKDGVIDFIINENQGNLEITIRDYGKGISNEVKGKLFKEMVTTKGKNGTGLGLYMCYSTIKGRFGGNIWFDSEENKGTSFYISIPIKNLEYIQG